MVRNNSGPEGYLSRNWKSYDLAKFIIGYERFNEDVSEPEDINHMTPSVLRMAGFPVYHNIISPISIGASSSEYAIGMPQKIAKELQSSFPKEKIYFCPGNAISMYSCLSGLEKDGIKRVGAQLSSINLRLFEFNN